MKIEILTVGIGIVLTLIGRASAQECCNGQPLPADDICCNGIYAVDPAIYTCCTSAQETAWQNEYNTCANADLTALNNALNTEQQAYNAIVSADEEEENDAGLLCGPNPSAAYSICYDAMEVSLTPYQGAAEVDMNALQAGSTLAYDVALTTCADNNSSNGVVCADGWMLTTWPPK